MKRQFLFVTAFCLTLFIGAKESFAQQDIWAHTKIQNDSNIWPVYLEFADSLVGYLQCLQHHSYIDSGLFFTDTYYYRTIDGGASWQKISFGNYYIDSGTAPYSYYEKIRPAAHNIAYVRVWKGKPDSTHQDVILRTTDMGSTWLEVQTNDYPIPLHFFYSTYGIGATTKDIFYTKNSVSTWHQLTSSNDPLHAPYSIDGKKYQITQPNFPHEDVFAWNDPSHFIYAASIAQGDTNQVPRYGITFFMTTNGGSTWSSPHLWHFPSWVKDSSITIDHSIQAVENTLYAYIYTREGDHAGRVYNGLSDTAISFLWTSDGGINWNVDTSFLWRIRGFEATRPGEIWMCVHPKAAPFTYLSVITGDTTRNQRIVFVPNDSQYSASWIVHSTDFGASWDTDKVTLKQFNEVHELNGSIITSYGGNHIWIAAEDSGKVYIFRHVEPTNAVEGPDPPDFPQYINVYPNPAYENVKVSLWYHGPLKELALFDILGRNFPIETKRLNPSSLEFNVSSIHNGSYLLLIRDGFGHQYNRRLIVTH